MRTQCCGIMHEGSCSDCPLTMPIRPAARPPHQLGWLCPACGRCNAPWNATCSCGPSIIRREHSALPRTEQWYDEHDPYDLSKSGAKGD